MIIYAYAIISDPMERTMVVNQLRLSDIDVDIRVDGRKVIVGCETATLAQVIAILTVIENYRDEEAGYSLILRKTS